MFTSVKHKDDKIDSSLKKTVNVWYHWFIFVKISFTPKKIIFKFSVFLIYHLNNLNTFEGSIKLRNKFSSCSNLRERKSSLIAGIAGQ